MTTPLSPELLDLANEHLDAVKLAVEEARADGEITASEVLGVIFASRYLLADAGMVWAGVQEMTNEEKHAAVGDLLDHTFNLAMAWDWPGMTWSESLLKSVLRPIWPFLLPRMTDAVIRAFYSLNPARFGGGSQT